MLTISNKYDKIGGNFMPNFGNAEKSILSYFKTGTKVFYEGKECTVVEADKPTCSVGEPKTDVYVLLENICGQQEIKISYKKNNAHFLENKMSGERAEELFGPNWGLFIEQATTLIRDKFESRKLIYKNSFGKSQKGSITLGWKFELMLVQGGELSGTMNLSNKQMIDVYSGINLSSDKRDAFVNGKVVKNSGIANYILHADNVTSAQDVINKMVTIDEFIRNHPNIYFACKALNYRTFKHKYDGDRPLAVQVVWQIKNQKLVPSFLFNKPLQINGREVAEQLFCCLQELSINTTDDINRNNVDITYVYE